MLLAAGLLSLPVCAQPAGQGTEIVHIHNQGNSVQNPYAPRPVVDPPVPEVAPPMVPTEQRFRDGIVRLDLNYSWKQAMAASPRLAELRERILEQRSHVDEAYTLAYPTLGLTSSYTNNYPAVYNTNANPPTVVIPPQAYNFTLAFRQILLSFGRLRWSTAAAELTEKSAKEEYRQGVEQILSDVSVSYLDAILAAQNVEIAAVRLQAQQRALQIAQALFSVGRVAAFDVLRAASQVSAVSQTFIQAQNDSQVANDRLLTLMGIPPGTPLQLSPMTKLEPPPKQMASYTDQALQYRPELGVLRWAVQAAKARVNLEESQDAPQLELQNQGIARTQTGLNAPTQNVTALVLSVPIFDGGLAGARSDAARHVVEETRQQLSASERQVRLEVSELFHTLQSTWQRVAVAEQNVLQAAEVQRVAFIRYQAGVANQLELLTAQTAYNDALLAKAQAERDYQSSWARWHRAVADQAPEFAPPPLPFKEEIQ